MPALIFDAYRQELHRLTTLLGHSQDLHVVRTTVVAGPDAVPGAEDRAVMLALVDQRERDVRGQALSLAARVFADRPKSVAARFAEWWGAWHE